MCYYILPFHSGYHESRWRGIKRAREGERERKKKKKEKKKPLQELAKVHKCRTVWASL
jgi:hypothetical protein